MRLILIRHGETAWNREKKVQGVSDISLNETGVRQAHRLALSLKDEKINAIYTSPLKRAYDTARIIGQFHGASIYVESGLMEMNPGDFEGLRAFGETVRETSCCRHPAGQPWPDCAGRKVTSRCRCSGCSVESVPPSLPRRMD